MYYKKNYINQLSYEIAGYEQRLGKSGSATAAETLAEKIALYYTDVEPMYRISEYDGKKHFEEAWVWLRTTTKAGHDIAIQCRFDDYRKKYYFMCVSLETLRNITSNDKDRATKSLMQPNVVGVLNTKKIQSWVDYYSEYYDLCYEANNDNCSEVEQFLKSIEGLEVHWWANNTKGEIIQNGIKFSFQIETGYVSKRIETHYEVPFTVEAFLQLSDNKFVKTK